VILSLSDLSGPGGEFALNISSATSDDCFAADIGSELGDTVFSGNLQAVPVGLENECGGSGAASVITWEAPYSSSFLFRTWASVFDPVMDVRYACRGNVLDCNDDYEGLESGISLYLDEGARIIIVVQALDLAPPGAPFILQIYSDFF
jgi:hypothetical protein